MVHFAASSMFFHEYPLGEIFDYIAEAGLDSVEFWVETPHFWISGQPEDELLRCFLDHPQLVSPTVHAPVLDLNPCSINPRVAEASVRYAVEAIELGGRMGAEAVTVHPGRRTAKRIPSSADYERFSGYIGTIREAAHRCGIPVAMENMERKVNSMLCTPESTRELLDREPWLWFTLDISHAMGVSEKEVKRYIDLCCHRMVNVHVSRAVNGKMHLPVAGSGEIAGILRHLGDCGYEKNLTLEIEDRAFSHDLCSEEKIILLSREVEFMHECF